MSISPGPWGWVGTEGRQKRLTDATGREVVMGDGGRGFVLCSEADARAIASVPTMVELLRTLGEQFEEWSEDPNDPTPRINEDGTDLFRYWGARIEKLLSHIEGKP